MFVTLAPAQGSIGYLGAIFVIGSLAKLVHEISDTISALPLHVLILRHICIRHGQITALSVDPLTLLRLLSVEPLVRYGLGSTTKLLDWLGFGYRLFDRN